MAARTTGPGELLSIADIARHFSIPESTARYYCKRFAPFIPCVGEGRRRRYRPETRDVIAVILDEMRKSRTAAAVEGTLTARFPRNVVALSKVTPQVQEAAPLPQMLPTAALRLLERQTLALEGLVGLLQGFLERHAPTATPRADEHEDLRQEVDRLRILLDASEKNQQADLEQLRTWMARLIRERGEPDTAGR